MLFRSGGPMCPPRLCVAPVMCRPSSCPPRLRIGPGNVSPQFVSAPLAYRPRLVVAPVCIRPACVSTPVICRPGYVSAPLGYPPRLCIGPACVSAPVCVRHSLYPPRLRVRQPVSPRLPSLLRDARARLRVNDTCTLPRDSAASHVYTIMSLSFYF